MHKDEKLGLAVSDFQVCGHCRFVDRDRNRITLGYACPVCGRPSDGGRMYFSSAIHTLSDLIEYELAAKTEAGDTTHDVSVVLAFFTLRELLLDHLIEELGWVQGIPSRTVERILEEHHTVPEKQSKALPAILGESWRTLVAKQASPYPELADFLERTDRAITGFMFEGGKSGIPPGMARDCRNHLPTLIELFVILHNRYIHPPLVPRTATR